MSSLRPFSRLLTTPLRTTIPSRTPSIFTLRTYATKSTTEKKSEAKIDGKDELHPRRREATKSSYDDEIGSDDAAYDPSVTEPRREKGMVGDEEGKPKDGPGNPLDASGATPERSLGKEDDRPAEGKERGPSGGKGK